MAHHFTLTEDFFLRGEQRKQNASFSTDYFHDAQFKQHMITFAGTLSLLHNDIARSLYQVKQ